MKIGRTAFKYLVFILKKDISETRIVSILVQFQSSALIVINASRCCYYNIDGIFSHGFEGWSDFAITGSLFTRDHRSKFRQHFSLLLDSLLFTKKGQCAALVSTVNLILLSEPNSFHSSVSTSTHNKPTLLIVFNLTTC